MKQPVRYRYRKTRRRQVRRLLVLVSAVLFILAGAFLARYLRHAAQAGRTLDELRGQYNTSQPAETPASPGQAQPAGLIAAEAETPADAAPPAAAAQRAALSPDAAMRSEFVSLYGKNKDLVGWLRSDALPEIDFPVVQRDNAFYMDRDFYGRENLAGTVFLDQSGSILPRADNLVLHGHNMKNGSMFGKLHLYLEEDFLRARPTFTFSTLYETADYLPYAVSLVSTDPESPRFAAFVQSGFASGEDMLLYARRLADLSVFQFPDPLREDDRLLTLVTCHGNEDDERLIVALRELRPGEDREALAGGIRDGLKRIQ